MWQLPLLAKLFPHEVKIRPANRWLEFAILRAMKQYKPGADVSFDDLMAKLDWWSYIFLSNGLPLAMAELQQGNKIWRQTYYPKKIFWQLPRSS